MAENFLFHHEPRAPIKFGRDKVNAARMYARATTWPCPLGIATTAKRRWREARADKPFYGWSHMTPTPREYVLQQLGLVITKAHAVHLRNAERRFGPHPRGKRKGKGATKGGLASGISTGDGEATSGGRSRNHSPRAVPP